jgi:hypothetical protein
MTTTDFFTPGRLKPLGRLLVVAIALGAVLALLSLPLILGDYERYGVIVAVVGVVLLGSGGLAVRAIRARDASARKLAIITGVLQIVLSLPLMPIWIGLLTVISGIGLLVVVFAPEREEG